MSASNLKPWKPGQSGNPGGMPRIPNHLRGIASLTQLEIVKIVSKYARMTRAELQLVAQDPQTPMLEVAICSVFANSAKHGDYARLAFLLDRAVGKPRDVSADDDAQGKLAAMNDDELIAHVEEIIKKRKGDAA